MTTKLHFEDKLTISQGAEITEDTRGTHSVIFTQKVSNNDKTHTLQLYSSSQEQAPDWQSPQSKELESTSSAIVR